MLREQPSSREISFLEQVEPEVKVYAEVKPLPQVVPKKIVARSSGWGFVGYMYLGCSVLWAFNGSLDLAAGDYWGIGGAACDFGLSAIWGLCAYLNVKANKH